MIKKILEEAKKKSKNIADEYETNVKKLIENNILLKKQKTNTELNFKFIKAKNNLLYLPFHNGNDNFNIYSYESKVKEKLFHRCAMYAELCSDGYEYIL